MSLAFSCKIWTKLGTGHIDCQRGLPHSCSPASSSITLLCLEIFGDVFIYTLLINLLLYQAEPFLPLWNPWNSTSTPGGFFKLFLLKNILFSLKNVLENTASSDYITWGCKLYEIREVTGYSFPEAWIIFKIFNNRYLHQPMRTKGGPRDRAGSWALGLSGISPLCWLWESLEEGLVCSQASEQLHYYHTSSLTK